MTSLQNYPALLLNADYMPLSYRPLSLLHWQKAVRDVFHGRVTVVEEHDRIIRTQGGLQMRVPSVVALKEYQTQNHQAPITRMGIYLREQGHCAYCHRKITRRELTFDHVHPSSKGGRTTWDNVVASCQSCNSKKGHKSLKDSGFTLAKKPYAPTKMQLNALASRMPILKGIPQTWKPYLGLHANTPTQETPQQGTGIVFPNGMTAQHYWDAELDM